MSIISHRNVRFVILLTTLVASASCSAKPKTDDVIPSKQDAAAQSAPSQTNDDSTFTAIISAAKAQKVQNRPIGERIVAMGKMFLGVPYVSGTLDQDTTSEDLVVNLHGLDCVTFYENSLALARVISEYSNPTLKNYQDELTLLRYRDGKRAGYPSRLHYSIDYFNNSEKKGVMKNITRLAGGSLAKQDTRTIDFMTQHRASYKQLLHSDADYAAIGQVERDMNARKDFYYIPKEDIAKMEKNIQSGDILGITTNVAGLDCSHTGIAVRGADGRIHFMHASSLQHKVIVTDEPLAEYLTHSSHQTGIIVNRPQEIKASEAK